MRCNVKIVVLLLKATDVLSSVITRVAAAENAIGHDKSRTVVGNLGAIGYIFVLKIVQQLRNYCWWGKMDKDLGF